MKKMLLRLLLLPGGLETAEAWAAALEGGNKGGEDSSVLDGEEEEDSACAPLIAAMDEVVPYLPDYSAVSSKLKALMAYVDASQVDRLVQGWLRRTPALGGPFRRWILREWLECSHLTSAEPGMLLQWRRALLVAVTNETVKSLKWTLLKRLSAVDEVISEQLEDSEDAAGGQLQSIETVEELLDFCWVHANQLSTCSLLCAAKLHALAVRTQRNAISLAEDDDVLVRLRWSTLLKPVLFKPLLQHAVALKVFRGSITASQLWMSEDLAALVRLVDLATRETLLMGMRAGRDELENAFAGGAEYVYSSASQAAALSPAEDAVRKYVRALPAEKRKLLLAELERDLDEAPPHMFPHIFMFLGLIISSAENQELVGNAVGILYALFVRRSHDVSSCLDVLALQVGLSLSSHPLLQTKTSLYIQTVESLSEMATLHVEPQLKWTARMALQQLLFECDVQLLQAAHSTLSNFLPFDLSHLVTIRLGS
ncbi:hypothetical protein KRP22_012644 [Phytophthora ramorum]|nr:hypothetical protein KRP22_12958 [Phytophthora ramorum]